MLYTKRNAGIYKVISFEKKKFNLERC